MTTKEYLDKVKALDTEIEELDSLVSESENNIKVKQEEYKNLILNGEDEKANSILNEIDQIKSNTRKLIEKTKVKKNFKPEAIRKLSLELFESSNKLEREMNDKLIPLRDKFIKVLKEAVSIKNEYNSVSEEYANKKYSMNYAIELNDKSFEVETNKYLRNIMFNKDNSINKEYGVIEYLKEISIRD